MDDLISRLSELRCQYNCFDENERDAYHALSEAIKALSDVPDTNIGDTINRQAAIRWVKTECNPYGNPTLDFESGKRVIEHLLQMPSTQPEPELDEWCTDCKEYDQKRHCCPRFRRVIRETVEDIRQNAQTEVVRCKDCINFTKGKDEWGSCFENPLKMWRETDFCSWGERRDDAD